MTRLICITTVLLPLLCCVRAEPQTCTSAPAGLVSWWTADTNENDIISGNNPSAVNAVTLVPGEVKSGFTFGTGGYIDIPATTSLANQQFTWAAWVMPAGPGPNNDSYGSIIVDQDIDATNGSVDLLWSALTQHFVFIFGNIQSELIVSPDTFPAGTFYFVTASYDGSTFRLFVNGVSEGSFAKVKTVPYSSVPWMIGSAPPPFISLGYSRTWNGIIDEVQAYNVALSQSQIQAIFNAGHGGVCKGLTFSPTGLMFPRQTVGTTSSSLTANVTNSFPMPVAISHVVTGGDFAQTNTCPVSPATLAPGTECSVSVTFTPTTPGTRTGWVGFADTAPSSPQFVGLAGAATDISLSTAVLKYLNQVVGTPSAPQTVTVTNVGSAAVNFIGSGIVIGGANPSDFTISNNTCGSTLAGNAECTVSVDFTPTADGTRTAILELNDDSGASPQTVGLGGLATNVSLSAANLAFGTHKVGTTSAAQTVTVTNVGTATVNFTGSGITIAGPNPADFLVSAGTCAASLSGGAQCKVSVEFRPTATGLKIAALLFNDDGGASPQYVVLFGTGT